METRIDKAALIHESLELIAERVTDLTPLVYARYFSHHPEAKDLFGNDSDDDLKGRMLSKLILQIMEYAEGRSNPDIIASWAVDHLSYGVGLSMFPAMFSCLGETLREAAGTAWTEETDAAWRDQFDNLMAHIQAAYQRFSPAPAM